GVEYCEDCGAALVADPPAGPATRPEAGISQPMDGAGTPPPSAAPVAEHAPETAALPDQAPPAGTDSTVGAPGGQLPSEGARRPRLLVKRFGATTGEEIPLLGERLVVGRFDPDTGPVDIDLSGSAESANVSRQHGELYRDADGRWYVRDLGSTNGIFVKPSGQTTFGPRISAPRVLGSGDELAFGNARFVVEL